MLKQPTHPYRQEHLQLRQQEQVTTTQTTTMRPMIKTWGAQTRTMGEGQEHQQLDHQHQTPTTPGEWIPKCSQPTAPCQTAKSPQGITTLDRASLRRALAKVP